MTDIYYPVNEIFTSVQGEGRFTGHPSIFIRLQSCDVGCPWCDTKHSWDLDESTEERDEFVLNKKGFEDQEAEFAWANIKLNRIIQRVQKDNHVKHIVITGGEPCLHNLLPLVNELESLGFLVQIETSGTEPLSCTDKTYVTVSPKIRLGNQKPVLKDVVKRANEIKFVCGNEKMLEKLTELLEECDPTGDVYLQPLSLLEKSTQFCFDKVIEMGWKLSLQTHKFIKIR